MLTAFSHDLWFAEHDLWMPGGVQMRGRMTVARLPDGSLWLHSPVPIEDALAAELDALGPVRHVVAPNLYHHLQAGAAIERYPEARLYGAPGLDAKRGDLKLSGTLGDSPPPEWGGALESVLIQGAPGLNEVVFLHRPSRTLIVTDFVFHIRDAANWITPWALRTTGTWGKLARSRVWWWMTRDKALRDESVARVLEWDFDRLLMAHGRPVDGGARAAVSEIWRG